MNTGSAHFQGSVVIALVLTTVLLGTIPMSAAEAEGKIDIYITPETEYLPVGELISYLLEEKLEIKVNKKVQYQDVGLRKVANGKGDLFIGLKFPPGDEMPWSYSSYQLCDLGPIYEDVVAGWGVPAYIAEADLGSVEDLENKNTKSRLHREIIVYESEKKLLEASKKLVHGVKGLQDYQLVELGEMVANSELDRAMRNKEWIVTSLKRPSVPFSLYNVRFIENLTEEQSVHLFGRNDLMAEFSSETTQFLSRFYMPINFVNEFIRTYDQDREEAVRNFVESHPELVDYWIKGVKTL